MFSISEYTVHAVILLVHLSLFQLYRVQFVFKLITVDGPVAFLLVAILAGKHLDEFSFSLVLIVFVTIFLVFKLNNLHVMLKLRRNE